MKTVLLESHEATRLLEDDKFQLEWQDLSKNCPWSTAFQGTSFVTAWYHVYADKYDPIILKQTDASGRLRGLLTLASERGSGRPIFAGTHHAEYQVWLSWPDDGDDFILSALQLLRAHFPNSSLSFKFLPAGTPVQWVQDSTTWRKRTRSRFHQRPLIDLSDRNRVEATLKKRGNRNYLNRLSRVGKVCLRHVTSVADFEDAIDQIALQYDLRQGGLNDATPFYDDPHKKEFHIEMMRSPGLLHVTQLTVGDICVGSHIGTQSRDTVSSCIFSLSPDYVKYRTGKLLRLLLNVKLAKQGLSCFDLTPGGDWKNQFATSHDTVEEMTVFFARAAVVRHDLDDRVVNAAKRCLGLVGVTPAHVRSALAWLSRIKPSSLLRHARNKTWQSKEMRVYYYDAAAARRFNPDRIFSRDKLLDLLAFEPSEPGLSRRNFLMSARERLEEGQHAYSLVENGRLVYSGWLIHRQEESFFNEVEQSYRFLPNTAVVYDFYTHPGERGRGLHQAAMRQMLSDAAREDSVQQISVSVLADNGPWRHAIEKMGFRYATSVHYRRRFWRTAKWEARSERG